MPIYEDENTTREDLDKIRRKSQCKVCGSYLALFWDMKEHRAYLACADWTRTHHEGIEREASRYEKEGIASLNIPTRREIMEQEYGAEKTKALERYIGTVAITKRIATEIVETLWGGAPVIEKTKCILLCRTYQLNPLMKHLYLVGYKRYKDKKPVVDNQGNPIIDWSIQIGIGATRLMAQRKHNYSYLDMTPRKATKAEIEKILGDTADPNCIYGFVHIRDVTTGAEAFGLRGIERDANIKGMEKGNTHLNMACIRAERLALDRQYPGEMPQGVEVVDERFIEADYKVVDEETGEITETEPAISLSRPPESLPTEHWCEEHNCRYEKKTGRFGEFYAHKKPEGGWCNEKKKKGSEAIPETEPAPEYIDEESAQEAGISEPEPQQPKRDPDTIKTFSELYKACSEDFTIPDKDGKPQKMQPYQVIAELGVSSQSDISDTPAFCYLKIKAVRE